MDIRLPTWLSGAKMLHYSTPDLCRGRRPLAAVLENKTKHNPVDVRLTQPMHTPPRRQPGHHTGMRRSVVQRGRGRGIPMPGADACAIPCPCQRLRPCVRQPPPQIRIRVTMREHTQVLSLAGPLSEVDMTQWLVI